MKDTITDAGSESSGRGRLPRERAGATYAHAGVDIAAGDRAVDLIKVKAKETFRPEVVGGIGGFAGLIELDTTRYRRPLLASSTDGVGTKLVIAQRMDVHDTVGIDLVAMVVDDLVVCGAEPLFLQDYVACGKVVPEKVGALVGGIADACRWVNCVLLGGEIAEHPDLLGDDEYDVSATGVGVVEADLLLGKDRVAEGDVLIAMGSSGLHSNGYVLARHVLLGEHAFGLEDVVDDLGRQRSLGEELLTPTTIYAQHCLELVAETDVHGFAHVTGGGLPGNVCRVLPENLDAVIDRSTWRPAPIFDLIAKTGPVEQQEMERTFNMGVGMVAVVSSADAERAVALLAARHVPAWIVGEIVRGTGEARLVSSYAM